MEDETTTSPRRKPSGPLFFLGAMAFYLFLVHGLSLWSAGLGGTLPPLGERVAMPEPVAGWLAGFASATGHSRAAHAAAGLLLLYACMVTLFCVTRRLVQGPVWLGSLAGSSFMAHPVKTEVLFQTAGLYHLLAALLALLSVLGYLHLIARPSPARYVIALALFAGATFPFSINAPLLGLIVLLECYPATSETRRWGRLAPFLALATLAWWFHSGAFAHAFPAPGEMLAPLLLLLYPIGLLPETVQHLQESPPMAWFWGAVAIAFAVIAFAAVRNGAFRVCLVGILLFRFVPGAGDIDLSTLDGGGQLIVPLALACLMLAAFTRWLMQHKAWGQPAVALTTMLCVVLFVLQFQANRARTGADTRVPDGPTLLVRETSRHRSLPGGADDD